MTLGVKPLAVLGLVAGLAACTATEDDLKLATDKAQERGRLVTVNAEVARAAQADLIDICLNSLRGAEIDDSAISPEPFAKSTGRNGTTYVSRAAGAFDIVIKSSALTVDGPSCVFRGIPGQWLITPGGGRNTTIQPDFLADLAEAGGDLGAFKTISLGGSFMTGALQGLVPKPTQRLVEKRAPLTVDGEIYELRIVKIQNKSDMATLATLVEID